MTDGIITANKIKNENSKIMMTDIQWNAIYHGDCIEGMRRLGEGTVDLVFADPPFNIGYKYDVYYDKLNDNDYWEWSEQWMSEVYRILKPDGTFWLAIGDEYAAELKMIATRNLHFICRNWVIWYYTFGVNCKHKFTRSHVHLLYFVKNAKQFTFNDNLIRVPSARQRIYKDKRANPCGRLPDDTWVLRPQELEQEFGADKDTWFVSRVCGTFNERTGWHGCQMPETILERIITVSSRPNEKILDPFLGSGTTVVVAKKLGRQFLGFELSKEYWEQCQKRINLANENIR
ncbi:MAG: site-specific DNA-methyltransferase [Planctomycetaceae bacterium]|jgi:site-specific DNA-methyltransferase (adenine-specific)|nr:site-specific DNA-methyltransferase [Planctomycetaceae bacterium]